MIGKILSTLLCISIFITNPLTTLSAHAGSNLNDPSTISTAENTSTDSDKFENKIPKINEMLKSLLEQVADMQSLKKDENLILLQIRNAYNEIKKETTLEGAALNPLLTQHVVSLITIAIQRSQELTGTGYRSPQLQSDTMSPDTIVSSHYASTRELAYSLKANDLATLLILSTISSSIELQKQTTEDISNFKHRYTILSANLMGAAFNILTAGVSLDYVHYTSMPLIGASIVATILVGAPLSYISYFKPMQRDNLRRRDTESLATSLQSLIDALQSQLGDTAAPLIEALRTGDTDVLRSAACQYALTPKSAPRVRVETEAAQMAETAGGAAAQQAEVHEVINSAPVQRRYEVVPRP